MNILVAFDTIDEGFEPLFELGAVTRPPKGRDFTREELKTLLPDTDILCAVFDIPVDKELIDLAPKLRLIANYAVGYNNIDVTYASAKGIVVTNTPRSVVEPTADLALSLLLACTRRTVMWHVLMADQRENLSHSRLSHLGLDLFGKTLGVWGFGNIGKAVARRCKAFGMNVLYNKRTPLSPDEEKVLGVKYASAERLLTESDVISLHTPLTSETHHLIGAKEFALMKKGAIIINTARGAVIDEAALIQALQQRHLYAAGLDVFEHNDIPSPELYELPNVVMTPHIGTQTYDARRSMLDELCNNVVGFIHRDRLINRVN